MSERKKIEKVEKLVATLHDNKYVTHIRNLRQALNHELVLKKVIKFNQKSSLESYIDIKTELRKNAKNDFKKDFFKLMKNVVLGKTMENKRNHRHIYYA